MKGGGAGGQIILRSVGQEEDEAQRFHGDKRETLGRDATSDFREHDHRQTQPHPGVVSRSYRSRQVAGFKMSLVGRKRAGETGGRGSRGRLGCRLDVPSGMAGVLHYTDGEGVCFFWELRRAALFSRLRCYLDGKVAIWQKSRGS